MWGRRRARGALLTSRETAWQMLPTLLGPHNPPLQRGYPGACMTDRGCMAIQPGQLDQECGAAASLYGQAPTCSPACLATLSAVSGVHAP